MPVDSALCSRERAEEKLNYLFHQREGIERHYALSHGGSCEEGLISHYMSKRFSRDPMGWSLRSLRSLSALRIYQLNGGEMDSRLLAREQEMPVQMDQLQRHVQDHRERQRTKQGHDWNVIIPGVENAGGSLGGWMKGIQRGGFIQ